MDGILVTLKPPGMSSHDVVNVVRRLAGQKRVGHTGTLDPGAAGILVVCLGAATRLAEYLSASDKRYRAEAVLGAETDTQDAQGRVTRERPTAGIGVEQVVGALAGLVGEWNAPPPMVSAVRHEGRRLYEIAREGKTVEREPRRVHVLECVPVDFDAGPPPRVLFDVACAKGTYVRTLCAELGERLGCGAYMSFLVRTRNGPWGIDDAVTLEELQAAQYDGALHRHVLAADRALDGWPRAELDAPAVKAIVNGARVGADVTGGAVAPGRLVRVYDRSGRFMAVASAVAPASCADGAWTIAPVKVLVRDGERDTP